MTQINIKYMDQSKVIPSHKRGLSGTAIFGFINHDNNLSISSLQRSSLGNITTATNKNDNNKNDGNPSNISDLINQNDSVVIHNLIEQEDEVCKLIL